ncbi:hypothetical protein BDV06DRAFT_228414 [Aspergillus oleicola]
MWLALFLIGRGTAAPKDVIEEAALPHMVKAGHTAEVREILEAKSIPLDTNVLDIAILSGNAELVQLLRQYGYYSQGAYELAIERSDIHLVELLEGDPNLEWYGSRPLHAAVRASSLESVIYLLQKGAKQKWKDSTGQTAFNITVDKQDEHIIKALNKGRHYY